MIENNASSPGSLRSGRGDYGLSLSPFDAVQAPVSPGRLSRPPLLWTTLWETAG